MSTPTLDSLIAHSDHGNGPQTLREHMAGVTRRATAFAEVFGGAPFAHWLGWWHDAGKVAPDVQAYLRGETNAQRGPDHSSAGMLEAWETLPFLSNIIAGHHSGLDDAANLKERVAKKQSEARVTEARFHAASLLVDVLSAPETSEIPAFLRKGTPTEQKRRVAFWQRMLHSALIDADRLDAEAHGDPDAAVLREAEPLALSTLRELLETDQQRLIRSATNTLVNRIRADLYHACLEAASLPTGFFSLTVPTGGGKTRSALAFALRHACLHGQRRVIVTLPFTSIIEQNAAVYRDLFGKEAVLEHHSAVHQPRRKNRKDEDDETERKITLAAENWDAPIVVTTAVQFFESLFAAQNGRLRKLHRVARSVIVLDEAQTLPPDLLIPTLEALRFLVEDYGCTVVFCTATQPAFRSSYGDPYQAHFAGFDITEIIPDAVAVYDQLRRVRYEVQPEPWSWEAAARAMREAPQALAIVNTVKDAQALFDALDHPHAFHLSTRLCPLHRRRVLEEVKRRLKEKQPVYLVATQVVEAGVDISFPLVLRALGPLDSLIQAAGRCNREGELSVLGRVVVFEPVEGGMPPGAYRAGADQTQILRRKYGDAFAEQLHSPDLPLEYFERLYGTQNLDRHEIQNREAIGNFWEVAQKYRLIEETIGVVVPYAPKDDEKAIRSREAVLHRITQRGQAWRDDWRALQPFTVNLRQSIFEQAAKDGLCVEVVPGVWRWSGAYDSRLQGRGLTQDHAADEALIC